MNCCCLHLEKAVLAFLAAPDYGENNEPGRRARVADEVHRERAAAEQADPEEHNGEGDHRCDTNDQAKEPAVARDDP